MVYGLVAEFNPFHNGHKFLIEKAEGTVISVTSSSFVQRGDISIINKYDKTKAALCNGVDIVIELPAVYSLSSAEIFAKSAVSILNATGITDRLIFGCECGDIDLLKNAVSALDKTIVQQSIKKRMENGLYYPRAVCESIKEICGERLSSVFEGANNILAVEYIKALQNTNIEHFAVKRTGSGHDSDFHTDNIAGGSYIRKNFSEHKKYTPEYRVCGTAHIKNIEKLIIYKLSSMSLEEIKYLPDVAEGLENRIYKYSRNLDTLEELCSALKTKRYTLARIRRILCCALLGINEELQKQHVPYIRVLGFTENGEKYLKKIKQNSPIPLIMNLGKDYSKLSDIGKQIMDKELLASKLYSLASDNNTTFKNDFRQQVIKI